MASEKLNIAIVGAGTAGPAAAIFLARTGHQVRLFERAPVKLPVGAGFLLQPTGMQVMQELGLLEKLLPHTATIRRLHCLDAGNRALLDLHYDHFVPGLYGAGTHRATMLDLLLDAASEAGVEILWDHAIADLAREVDGRPVLKDVRGLKHGPFDLVLLCDGAQSSLRTRAGISCCVDRYPWGALWFIGRRPSVQPADVLWQRVGSTRELVGLLPTGTKDDLVSLFWSIRLQDVAAWKRESLEHWKNQVLALAPQAGEMLAQITSHEQMAVAAYHDARFSRWHGERIAILGDAGHALSPQLGQGVNLALMDASVLAQTIFQYPLQEALGRYSQLRRSHLRFYQLATRWLTPFFQSDAVMLGTLRDALFPLAGKIPWVRRQMIATMAGCKTGIFSRTPLGTATGGGGK